MKTHTSAFVLACTFGLSSCGPAPANRAASAPAPAPAAASNSPNGWATSDGATDAPPPERLKLPDEVVATFFDEDIPRPSGGYTYAYGGKTTNRVVASSTPGNRAVFATHLDNDYSGVNISLGNQPVDLRPYRKTGSLTFWIKAGPAAQKFMVGLMDNQGGPRKVQTKLSGDAYAMLQQGEWVQCRIPLKAFIDDGMYWDANQRREISAKMDWSKITDFRISINRDENKVQAGSPVTFYLDRIELTRTAQGVPDPDAYWDAFSSKQPDRLVTDYTRWQSAWKFQHGSSAEITGAVTAAPKPVPRAVRGEALRVDFKPGDWFDAFLEASSAEGLPKDWSQHYAVSVWLYTDKPYQSFDFVIRDRDSEMFLTKVGAPRGWHRVLIPFRRFTKFAYYQPPEAKQNNQLDLDGITQFGIKPGGDVPGTLFIAQVELTNQRELVAEKRPAQLAATFSGDVRTELQKVPAIYGINVGLWAPELLDSDSVGAQRPLNLGVVRYPGGLRSDEEDWRKTLKAKDFNVDTDEFLEWCRSLSCTPMFTANVGDGTPERAAAWVNYVNKTRSGPKVQRWEIGNELYGNWHKYYEQWGKDGGTRYGKAVRAYVKAMKAADPTIQISAVWMLGGPWNRAVFKEVADVIDAVSVHHYAQNAGAENDLGLLAASSEIDTLMKSVQTQVKELGGRGKNYEIWLTEWNSVDANPGPQILTHVNALFVADYLGHLASAPIQVANMWALYNGRDKRLGDYGVLACKGDAHGDNFRRPTYWAFSMLARNLNGTLLRAASDQTDLSAWMARRADGKLSLVFVNKNLDTSFNTTLRVPGLTGEATIEVLTEANSGGLVGPEATAKTHPSTGPRSEKRTLKDGSVLNVPKASIVSVRF